MKLLTSALLAWAITIAWAINQLDESHWNQPELTNQTRIINTIK